MAKFGDGQIMGDTDRNQLMAEETGGETPEEKLKETNHAKYQQKIESKCTDTTCVGAETSNVEE